MRRMTVTAVALVLVFAACGDDDTTGQGDTTTTAASSSTTATTAATTTTAAPTTSEATTTTEALSPSAAFIAGAVDTLGEYTGQWNNATFGSSGALYVNVIEVNTEVGFVLVQVDIDGFAFGEEDPELFVVEISTAGPEDLFVGFTTFLGGDAEFEIDEVGNFELKATPPLLGGMTLEVKGFWDGEGFGGTYEIPGLADGTWGVLPSS